MHTLYGQQQYDMKPMRPSGLPVTEYHADFPPQPLPFDNKQLPVNVELSSSQWVRYCVQRVESGWVLAGSRQLATVPRML
jgi:hypothetical protein